MGGFLRSGWGSRGGSRGRGGRGPRSSGALENYPPGWPAHILRTHEAHHRRHVRGSDSLGLRRGRAGDRDPAAGGQHGERQDGPAAIREVRPHPDRPPTVPPILRLSPPPAPPPPPPP